MHLFGGILRSDSVRILQDECSSEMIDAVKEGVAGEPGLEGLEFVVTIPRAALCHDQMKVFAHTVNPE